MKTQPDYAPKQQVLSDFEDLTLRLAKALRRLLKANGYTLTVEPVEDDTEEGDLRARIRLHHPTDAQDDRGRHGDDCEDCLIWEVWTEAQSTTAAETEDEALGDLYDTLFVCSVGWDDLADVEPFAEFHCCVAPPYALPPDDELLNLTLGAEKRYRETMRDYWIEERWIAPGQLHLPDDIGAYHLKIEKLGTRDQVYELICPSDLRF